MTLRLHDDEPVLPLKDQFAANLKVFLAEVGISQIDFGKLLGIGQSQISNIVRKDSKNTPFRLMEKARPLGVELSPLALPGFTVEHTKRYALLYEVQQQGEKKTVVCRSPVLMAQIMQEVVSRPVNDKVGQSMAEVDQLKEKMREQEMKLNRMMDKMNEMEQKNLKKKGKRD